MGEFKGRTSRKETTWTPTVYSGNPPGTAWSPFATDGRWFRQGGLVIGWGLVDLSGNGPSYQVNSLLHVSLPFPPIATADQIVVGSWMYVTDTSAYLQSGLLDVWTTSGVGTSRALCRTASNDASLSTSNRWRLSYKFEFYTNS